MLICYHKKAKKAENKGALEQQAQEPAAGEEQDYEKDSVMDHDGNGSNGDDGGLRK